MIFFSSCFSDIMIEFWLWFHVRCGRKKTFFLVWFGFDDIFKIFSSILQMLDLQCMYFSWGILPGDIFFRIGLNILDQENIKYFSILPTPLVFRRGKRSFIAFMKYFSKIIWETKENAVYLLLDRSRFSWYELIIPISQSKRASDNNNNI